MSALLAETGLRPVSTHLRLDALQGSQLNEAIRYCLDIGCSFMVLPWLANEWRTLEGIQTLAPQLNAIGRQCQEHGITFAYHKHDFEFTDIYGVYIYDHLLLSYDY